MQTTISRLTTGRTRNIYNDAIKQLEFVTTHDFIPKAYGIYKKNYPNNPSINGRIFEYLICESLAKISLTPFYYQAKFNLVPNADFDVVLYHYKKPVVLTMKTSLRERYKQAVLEGMALKQVYRQAKSYLITLSEKEVKPLKKKIQDGGIYGLDSCVIVSSPDFDILLNKLKEEQFVEGEEIMPANGTFFNTKP